METQAHREYWRKNLRYLAILLGVWFLVSRFTPAPPQSVQELTENIRIPRGAGEAHEISA